MLTARVKPGQIRGGPGSATALGEAEAPNLPVRNPEALLRGGIDPVARVETVNRHDELPAAEEHVISHVSGDFPNGDGSVDLVPLGTR